MPHRKAILTTVTFLSIFPIAPISVFAQTDRTLTEAPAQTGPISVTFDRTEAKYAVGEIVGMYIQASSDFYVTVLDISPNGEVIKLFPNKYQTETFVAAGKRIQVPDPASGAKLQVSGPVGKEQIRVLYSPKPLELFANLGSSGAGMFRSIDGGVEAVSRSLDDARSLGAKIGSETTTLTTVESLPAAPTMPPVAQVQPQKPESTQAAIQAIRPKVPVVTPEKPKNQFATKTGKPAKQVAKPSTQAAKEPKTYKIVTHLAPGQVLADDELELIGKVPDNTIAVTELRPYRPQQSQGQRPQMQMPQMQVQMQMPQMQMQMPQMQMPQMQQMQQMQMPQMQVPQMQMPQIKLPGGLQLQLPQIQLPIGRSSEKPQGSTVDVASTTLPICTQMLDKLNNDVAAKDIDAAAQGVDAIATSADCGQYQVVAQRRIAALRLSTAQDMMSNNKPAADYEPLLAAADGPQVLWQASATLGEVHFSERRFADAAGDYQRAIEIIKNESRTPRAPPPDTIDDLIQHAAKARILAANPSTDNPNGTFVPVEKDHRSGDLGGIYSQDVRGIVPVSIPVPITFDFNKSTFTQVGSQAAQELLEAIKQQKPEHVVLVGHTDHRGADDYNEKLSVRRAQAVADYLKSNGIDVTIEAKGKGAAEPIDVTASDNLTTDDIDALNRRVEWRRQ
ncbi:DUF4384 domain-containing protein [Rhizobium lusitanum]|uniref:Outer membrane protein OmpA-like peptidoglycan-associated protein n=1 Tax=Rhizobium lusitanum TaxID=293958 RepID=A0A7X0ITT6_9HYPH|nr:DUF4384 domain-containing protein [Rhizobium lusitanum]MBB6487061.1 outer membrane protein OmpA-like peptidoglycan-associated protein [Rhizobium lusitanum]